MSNNEYDKLFDLVIKVGDRFDDRMTILDNSLSSIDVKLAVQTSQLAEHMERTHLLEKRVDPLENAFKEFKGFKIWAFIIGGIASSAAGFVYLVYSIIKMAHQ